jgi:hypothetical protein
VKGQRFGGEAVEIWRGDLLVPHEAIVVPSLVVGDYEKDIRFVGRF